MFILSKNGQRAAAALAKLCAHLPAASWGPMARVPIGDYTLVWSAAKPADNLHVYRDAVIVGRTDFDEESSLDPVRHSHAAPGDLHPLLIAVRLRAEAGTVIIEPNAITAVYVSPGVASDMQLLVADHEGFMPSARGVAVLGAVGYLPGAMTLFDEIVRVPLLNSCDVETGRCTRMNRGVTPCADDADMLGRIEALVPKNRANYLAVSGGYDSRFILGCLRRAGVEPVLVHLADGEDPTVRWMAHALGLPLEISSGSTAPDWLGYTLMSDAQLYYKGGRYSRMKDMVPRDALLHIGHFAGPVLKNSYGSAWKSPCSRAEYARRLVRVSLLTLCPPVLRPMRDPMTRQDLADFLVDHLRCSEGYVPFRRRKQRASWMSYFNRGLRWAQASVADLGFFTTPVFLFSDLRTAMHGTGSSAWSNFSKERVRQLNRTLLPDLVVGYADGGPPVRSRAARAAVKVRYEYVDRWFARKRALKVARKPRRPQEVVDPIPRTSPPAFARYFEDDLRAVLEGDACGGLKRAAVTTHFVVQYLEAGGAVEPASRETG